MTSKRVSVDARALYDLIQSARSDLESLIGFGSVNPRQERKDFEHSLTRLKITEITE
jgi:hypothetical protein